MLTLLFCIALYSLIILLLVPLEKIGQWQTKIKNWVKKLSQ
jgi:hypothetical protein